MEREKARYDIAWSSPRYRLRAPGEQYVEDFLAIWPGFKHKNVVDWGAGTGRAGLQLKRAGHHVTAYDLSENCLDPEPAGEVGLVTGCLWDIPEDVVCDVGYCTDVMEHIPPTRVVDVLRSIKGACREGCYFAINFKQDRGILTGGDPLHLSVHAAPWWDKKLAEVFGTAQKRKVRSTDWEGSWWCQ